MALNDDLAKITFPECDEEAKTHFEKYEHKDPFAEKIPPALLNSKDISEYVRVTGMVHPFNVNEEGKLKSASYEVDFIGDVIYWEDGKDTFTKKAISKGRKFTIPKNSIVYVSPTTVFRLPDYIALRFNLRIRHVHRGLLLGTGPLVDPGFAGRLFIPLHNLTSEPYVLVGGEGLIWVEFTKISPHPHWAGNSCSDDDGYKHFPQGNRYVEAETYLEKSDLDGLPARSSIPLEIEEAVDGSREAKKIATETVNHVKEVLDREVRQVKDQVDREVRKFYQNITIGGIITLFLGVAAAVYPVVGLIQDANKYVSESSDLHFGLQNTIEEQKILISDLTEKVARLEVETRKLTKQERAESITTPE